MAVYFIQAGGDRDPVKIGYAGGAHTPAQRRSSLQSMNYLPLTLIRVIPDGCVLAESWLLDHFLPLRIRGEWFRFDPEMLTIKPPPPRNAVIGLRAYIRVYHGGLIAGAIGRTNWEVARWVRNGGAPPEAAAEIAALARSQGFDVEPRIFTAPDLREAA